MVYKTPRKLGQLGINYPSASSDSCSNVDNAQHGPSHSRTNLTKRKKICRIKVLTKMNTTPESFNFPIKLH